MKYSILKHIKCPNTRHINFRGEYEFSSFNNLFENMVLSGKWDNTAKQDLPMFCCTTFDYNIRSDKAKPTSLFALDFDDQGNNIDTALDYFENNGYFIYTSYSHTQEHHKFRVIIQLDTIISSNQESHMVFKILQARLHEVGLILDSACKDISRRFFLPSLNKYGEDPVCYVSEGDPISIKEDLIKEYEILERENQIREQKIALEKLRQLTSLKPKTKIDINKKIEQAKDKFLSDMGHQQLGKLIGTLLFWEVSEYEIANWVKLFYRPTTGTCEQEVRNWLRWHKSKKNVTYREKYGL